MAATLRTGHLDTLHQSRINWFTGTAYPAVPAGFFLALFTKLPLSDGTAGVEVTGTRVAITFAAATQDANGRWYIANSAPVVCNALNTTAPAWVLGYGIASAATAGSVNYFDVLPAPFQAAAAQVLTIPTGAIRIYAETVQ